MVSLMKMCTFSTPTSWCLNSSVQESHISYRYENWVLKYLILFFFFPQTHDSSYVFSIDLPQWETQHSLSWVRRALRDHATVLSPTAPLMRAFSIPTLLLYSLQQQWQNTALAGPWTHLLLSHTLSGKSVFAAARNRLVSKLCVVSCMSAHF